MRRWVSFTERSGDVAFLWLSKEKRWAGYWNIYEGVGAGEAFGFQLEFHRKNRDTSHGDSF